MNRILHVIGRMDRAGAETLVMNLYRHIDRTQYQFDFLVHTDEEADYDKEIESLGGKIYRLPSFTGFNLIAYRNACRKHFEEHPEHRIVHGHIGSPSAIYLSEAKRAGRFAIAHSHGENYETGLDKILYITATRPTRYIADYFIGCSTKAGIDRFGKKVVEGDRYALLKNGIDPKIYTTSEKDCQTEKQALGLADKIVFGHIGRFTEVKNHAFLIETFALLVKQLPNAILLLIGRGPLEDEIKALVNSKGIENNVMFLGLRSDVPKLLKSMDVFVFPSVSEGLPVSLVEAQATGLPCLVSTGISEEAVIIPEACRLPLSEGPQRWANELKNQAENVTRNMNPARIIRERGFDISQSVKELIAIYEHGII